MINFLSSDGENGKITDNPEDSFCYACRKAFPEKNCDECSREFKVIDIHKQQVR